MANAGSGSHSSRRKFKYADLLRKHTSYAEGLRIANGIIWHNETIFIHKPVASTTAKIEYDEKELTELAVDARKLIASEPTLLELSPPIVVVGDIHGQYSDLQRIFRILGSDMPGRTAIGKRKFLFLGDYVDRGSYSLECIVALLVFKLRYPKQFYLLRGNHETLAINRAYGFHNEISERFGLEKGQALWISFNRVFIYLPLAATIKQKILCMHGGIGPSLTSLDDIRNLKRPIEDPNTVPLACDLLWSDPMIDLKGYIPNSVRGVSVYFGEDTLLEACERLKIDLVVRAHQMMLNGYGFYCNRKLVTVFSAPRYYPEKNNKGAVMTVGKNLKIGFVLLAPVTQGIAGEQQFEEHFANKADDSSYTTHNRGDPNASTVVSSNQPAAATPATQSQTQSSTSATTTASAEPKTPQ